MTMVLNPIRKPKAKGAPSPAADRGRQRPGRDDRLNRT